MDDKKIEYVKLVFYEDRHDYDKSWGEVYYKLIYGNNQVHRTYKEKITKKEYPLCLKAFRLQEGTDALPFEKYQIYDAKTKKPLNMPYYLKKETRKEIIGDRIKDGALKTAELYYSTRDKIESLKRREKEEKNNDVLNSFKGGISDIRGYDKVVLKDKKAKREKMLVRLTSIATASVLLAALGNYELKKHKMDFSKMIFITKMDNSYNNLDVEIRNNYQRFENVINKLVVNEYESITKNDIDFVNHYIYMLSLASNDSLNNGTFYEFDYINYLDKNSNDYQFFVNNSLNYSSIVNVKKYKVNDAYDFCARGCNLLYYTMDSISTNKSKYVPSKNDIMNYMALSPLSKIVFLNQLKGVVVASNFSYKSGDEPYWWIGLRMNNKNLVEKIDQMIDDCNIVLEYNMSIIRNSSGISK